MLGLFLDIETTGLDFACHCPIDIACKAVDLATGELRASYQSLITPTENAWERRDLGSSLIHGYTWNDLVAGKDATTIAQEITSLFQSIGVERGKSVFICQNPGFDRAFFSQLIDIYTQEKLNWPYHWLDLASMYWAMYTKKMNTLNITIPDSINLSKNDIANDYHLPPEATPHHAQNGVDHLIMCYQAVLGVHFSFAVAGYPV